MRIYLILVFLSLNSLNLCAQITEDSLETFTAACIDGIDNDGDGLIDCEDPDCIENKVLACLPCFQNPMAYADSVEVFVETCTDGNNLFTDISKVIGEADFDGFYEGGNILSLGQGGSVILSFKDMLVSNSGDHSPDIGVIEVGADREGVYISLRPFDTFTRLMMQYSMASGPDSDGFYFFGDTDGGIEFFDIDRFFTREFSPERLNFDGIRLTDIPENNNCTGTSPGADIDAVCATGKILEDCLNGLDDDNNGLVDNADPYCNCGRNNDIRISSFGNICDESLVLSVDPVDNASYQWYHDGIAVQGAVLNEFMPGRIEGNIEVSVILADSCLLSEQIALEVPVSYAYVKEHICQGDSIVYNGEIFDSTGIYSFLLLTNEECDSIVEFDLEVVEYPITEINRTICRGDSVFYFGEAIKEEGQYPGMLVSSLGCDSLLVLNLSLEELLTDTLRLELCDGDSLFYRDSLILDSGEFNFQFNIPSICDSLIVLETGLLPTVIIDTSFRICAMDSLTFLDETFTEEGFYSSFSMTGDNCIQYDFDLIIDNAATADTLIGLCDGDFVILNDELFLDAGQYVQSLSTESGCDSTLFIEIVDLLSSSSQLDIGLCPGDFIELNGIIYNQAGQYSQELVNANGCDSLLEINIERLESSMSSVDLFLCEGTELAINDIVYGEPGMFQQVLKNQYGCDSIINVNIIQIDSVVQQRSYALCVGESILVSDSIISLPGVYIFDQYDQYACLERLIVQVSERVDCDQCSISAPSMNQSNKSLITVQKIEADYYKLNIELEEGEAIQKVLDAHELKQYISAYFMYLYMQTGSTKANRLSRFWTDTEDFINSEPRSDILYDDHFAEIQNIEINSIERHRLSVMRNEVHAFLLKLEDGLRYVREGF